VYATVFLLLIISLLKDKFNPCVSSLNVSNVNLMHLASLMFVYNSYFFVKLFWSYIPILNRYSYSYAVVDAVDLFVFSFILFTLYMVVRYYFKYVFACNFSVRIKYLSRIFIVCAVLTIANLLCIYYYNINFILNENNNYINAIKSMSINSIVILFFVNVIVGPILEESIFRGLLYVPLYRKVGRRFALIISSMIWTHSHFSSMTHSIGIFLFGIILGILYEKSGSLVPSIVLHMYRNSWVMIYLVN